MKPGFKYFLLVTGYWLLATGFTYADTIYTKDGKELRGIVVEDYNDRLVFSTVDGEIIVLKSNVNELYYDNDEDNLIKLAEQSFEKGDTIRAFAYYERAFRFNPNSKRAKDGIVFLQGLLFRKEQAQKEETVRRLDDFERRGELAETAKRPSGASTDAAERMRNSIGMDLVIKGNSPEIAAVRTGSPAYEGGLSKEDVLIAVWGRLTGYLSLEEVVSNIMERSALEVKCTIERRLNIAVTCNRTLLASPADLIGASLNMEFEGLTVSNVKEGEAAFKGGLKKGDLVVAINGKSTRYMPLKKAVEAIRNTKGTTVNLTVRRELTFWRAEASGKG